MPSSRHVRMTRSAISPRFAIRIFESMAPYPTGGGGQRSEPGPVKWVIRRFDAVDSTNRYTLDEARAGAPEGLVVVADRQEAGRGRRGRTWIAPPGSSLLVSVLLRPRLDADHAQLATMTGALAMVEAVERV